MEAETKKTIIYLKTIRTASSSHLGIFRRLTADGHVKKTYCVAEIPGEGFIHETLGPQTDDYVSNMHSPASHTKHILDKQNPDIWSTSIKISTIRNPWEQAVSGFYRTYLENNRIPKSLSIRPEGFRKSIPIEPFFAERKELLCKYNDPEYGKCHIHNTSGNMNKTLQQYITEHLSEAKKIFKRVINMVTAIYNDHAELFHNYQSTPGCWPEGPGMPEEHEKIVEEILKRNTGQPEWETQAIIDTIFTLQRTKDVLFLNDQLVPDHLIHYERMIESHRIISNSLGYNLDNISEQQDQTFKTLRARKVNSIPNDIGGKVSPTVGMFSEIFFKFTQNKQLTDKYNHIFRYHTWYDDAGVKTIRKIAEPIIKIGNYNF